MARYTGPKTKIARKFGEPIFGDDKSFEKRNYPPGQHGNNRRRGKKSEYTIQLAEKQKAKYTYGILERQFRNMFKKATAAPGITGVPYGYRSKPSCGETISFTPSHHCKWKQG